ncbi:MAG: glyoxalase/bleomycin resistance/dioxygenase family protein [Solirubrobacterales bacterium]
MEFKLALLAVKDVNVSKKFYEELFDQKVVFDFGRNVTFSGGFAIQEDFAWLVDIPQDTVMEKSNNMELYFEVEDFDGCLQRLNDYNNIRYVHQPKMHDWMQRTVRVYDPDYHIIEIGESMAVVARRYLSKGYSVEETSKIIQHPMEFVEMCKE